MSAVHVLNGPNLNLLGARRPEVYGTTTLADLEGLCARRAADHGLDAVLRERLRGALYTTGWPAV